MIINENFNYIILNYQIIINNYTKFFYKNFNSYKNIDYYEKIYAHGLNILQNIFNITSIYFYNISDVNNICEKGYIYFIEFINQLGINNFNENNIELSLKDAILFSYKKTILNLDKTNENTNNNEKKIFNILNSYIFLVNTINLIVNRNLYHLVIDNTNDIQNNINNVNNIILLNNNTINKIVKKINYICNFNTTLNRLNHINNIINDLLDFINKFNNEFINNINNKLIIDNNKILNFIKLLEKNINIINKNIV